MKYKNNPLNIRHSERNKWLGEVGQFNGFCVFSSQYFCYRAACRILLSYRKRGIVTLRQIISTWAPSSENNTNAYIRFLSDKLNLPSDVSIYSLSFNTDFFANLLYYMSIFEIGKPDEIKKSSIFDAVSIFTNLF